MRVIFTGEAVERPGKVTQEGRSSSTGEAAQERGYTRRHRLEDHRRASEEAPRRMRAKMEQNRVYGAQKWTFFLRRGCLNQTKGVRKQRSRDVGCFTKGIGTKRGGHSAAVVHNFGWKIGRAVVILRCRNRSRCIETDALFIFVQSYQYCYVRRE